MNTLKTSYDLSFLNQYFTTREFNFITDSNSENKKIEELISKETETRDLLVDFINGLNNMPLGASSEETLLLIDAKSIFEKINKNITILQELRGTSEEISDNIVKLLMEAEANQNNESEYMAQIKRLKNVINDFSTLNEQVQSKILLSNMEIENFLQRDVVKKYLDKFNLKVRRNSAEPSSNKKITNIELDWEMPKKAEESNVLIISEKKKRVFLPYSQKEILLYLEQYPNQYKNARDIIKKEFEVPLDYYMKHPVIARFRETYSLVRDREAKSVIDAFKYGFDLMLKHELNPAIIAACKTEQQLENYLDCASRGKLDEFKDFEIRFEVLPTKTRFKK